MASQERSTRGRSGNEAGSSLPRASARDDVLCLRSAIGNRATARLLARIPYEGRLIEAESVIQPPVSWTESPPDVERMTKLELFDAMHLLERWRAKHPKSSHLAALNELHDRIRKQAKRVTTHAEWQTFRRYIALRPDQLQGRYAKDAGYLIENAGERANIDIGVADAVIRDRAAAATWYEPARARLQGIMAEQDRRAKRFATLRWYQKGSFELHERKARQLGDSPGDLWHELAWLWIDLRDGGVDKEKAERRVLDELSSLYEQFLREVDAAIQADCKASAPRTWDERVRANIGKAWGDPCKPWFGPGGRGHSELHSFQMMLRIKRDDDPFACAYYWVEEYVKAYRSVTDPAYQLAQLRAQALVGMIGGAMALANYARFMKGVVVPFLGRRFGGFLRHTVMGWNLALGDLGGSGAEVGGGAKRPTVTVVQPGGGAGARPPRPDPVRRPTQDARDAPTTVVKPSPPPTVTPRPAPAPSPTPTTTLPPTGMRPPPTPVRIRTLSFRSADAVRKAVIARLSRHKTGMGTLPEGWDSVWDALKNNRGPTNDRIRDLLTVVMAALRNPKFYGDVMAEAWAMAWRANTSINAALLKMAADAGMKIRVVRQRRAGEALLEPIEFFEQYASQPAAFVDMPLAHNAHHAMTHLIQDLVLTRAFKVAGTKLTGPEFRALLGKAEGRFRVPRGAPIPKALWGTEMSVGDYVWQVTFDLFVTKESHLPQPEHVGQDLHDLLKIN